MTIVAQLFEHVVGIDTHARTHTYCLIAAATGAIVEPSASSGSVTAIRANPSCNASALPRRGASHSPSSDPTPAASTSPSNSTDIVPGLMWRVSWISGSLVVSEMKTRP